MNGLLLQFNGSPDILVLMREIAIQPVTADDIVPIYKAKTSLILTCTNAPSFAALIRAIGFDKLTNFDNALQVLRENNNPVLNEYLIDIVATYIKQQPCQSTEVNQAIWNWIVAELPDCRSERQDDGWNSARLQLLPWFLSDRMLEIIVEKSSGDELFTLAKKLGICLQDPHSPYYSIDRNTINNNPIIMGCLLTLYRDDLP